MTPPPSRPFRVVMIPSVSGGLGHISRLAILARALRRLDPSVEIEYVLDAERLRPFNVDATEQMGFRPRLMPPRTRDNRDAVVRNCLGDADAIVDDSTRYLVPLRRIVPRPAWISIPMHPVGDELFMDWPFLLHTDAVIWAYAPLVGLPPELAMVENKVVATGPFLDLGEMPDKLEARARLGHRPGERSVAYAPRGFPFGREFGHRVLAAVYGAVERLRKGAHPGLVLELTAVPDPTALAEVEGLPRTLPDWVRVHGLLPREESVLRMQAASVLVAEGSSTMHEGAALRTPMLLVPGPIEETLLLARRLAERGGARTVPGTEASVDRLAAALTATLGDEAGREEMAERALGLVTGGGGVAAAARLVLDAAAQAQRQPAFR